MLYRKQFPLSVQMTKEMSVRLEKQRGDMAQWVARLTRDRPVVNSKSKDHVVSVYPRVPSLLSTGLFHERTRA